MAQLTRLLAGGIASVLAVRSVLHLTGQYAETLVPQPI
jgi:hypothetical protein